MWVDVFPNRRTQQPMAIIEGFPAFFHRDSKTPVVNDLNEVMICGVLYHKAPIVGSTDGAVANDFNRPKALLIRLVQPDDIQVDFEGFAVAGTMCSTLSTGWTGTPRNPITLTPGRVPVLAADRVTTIDSILTSGVGWATLPKGKPFFRLEGVNSVHCLLGFQKGSK